MIEMYISQMYFCVLPVTLTSTINSDHIKKFINEKIIFYPCISYTYFHFKCEIGTWPLQDSFLLEIT